MNNFAAILRDDFTDLDCLDERRADGGINVVHMRMTLEEAVKTLTKPQKYVLKRFFLEDATADEVAEEMGITPGAVRAMSRRVKEKICIFLEVEKNERTIEEQNGRTI